MKRFFPVTVAAFIGLLLSLSAHAQSQYGWQTDSDGSVTGTSGTQFLYINSANFPDTQFRLLLGGKTYDTNQDGILTTTEVSNIKKLSVDDEKITGLQGINFLTELTTFECHNTSLTSLNLIYNTKIYSLTVTYNNKLTALTTPNANGTAVLRTINCAHNALSNLNVSPSNAVLYLYCEDNNLKTLNVSSLTYLNTLDCSDNQLETLSLPGMTGSGLGWLRHLFCNNNKLKELKFGTNQMYRIECENNQLTTLVGSGSELFHIRCGNNQLTEFTPLTGIFYTSYDNTCNLSPQTVTKDAVVIGDNREKIGIQCQTNNGNLESYGSYTAEQIDGVKYIILSDGEEADVDLYHHVINYDYLTWNGRIYGDTYENTYSMSVTITTSPYVMYINPKAKIGSNYYGTLYLDYDAKVPEGAKVYYASGITDDEELVMTEIPADKAIPARTAIYVEGEDGPGYYAFYEADAADELAVIGTNYLTGTLTGASVEARKALTLGHDKSSGELGFWNYSGTSIPAHRAYVTAETLSAAGGAKGLRLRFEDSSATGVRSVAAGSSINSDEDYYSVQGVRVDKGQLKKGVYIVNGHKVVVK